jgi:glyoxylase-like metal-dependent hydrolase (beta-lactamase superfamily II)
VDADFPLQPFGVPGVIIHTPGHSSGSVSILLETGDVFVGDLAMNAIPLRLTPGLPIFAEDLHRLRESWRSLLLRGAKTVYPAHGRPFQAEVLHKALSMTYDEPA